MTTAQQLTSMGHEAYDIESIPGMFAMYHQGSDELFSDYNNRDAEKIRDADWRCDLAALNTLFDAQQEDTAFYCAVASDMQSFMAHFDRTIALRLPTNVHLERLMNREGTGIMGGTEESRKAVLGWEHWWEEDVQKYGAHLLNAEGTPREVAERVLELCS